MNVLVEEQNLQDIAEAIRSKNNSDNAYKPSEMAAAIDEISSDSIDDSIYLYASRLSFSGVKNLPEIIDITIPNNQTSLASFFDQSTGAEEITVHSDHKITNLNLAFSRFIDNKVTKITLDFDTSKVTHWGDAFSGNNNSSIKEIIGLLDFSSATILNFTFGFCVSLIEVRVVPQTIKLSISFAMCYKLSDESIQSIIDGLADISEAETVKTITFYTTVKNKLTEEQIATINNKGWTLA